MRFLKNLFSVPKGKKVTDADMKRVLVSSVCGILVCMTCLISSTWAWYTVSVKTDAFTVSVADAAVSVAVNNQQASITESIDLEAGQEVALKLAFTTDATSNSFNPQPKRVIVMSCINAEGETVGSYYTVVGSESNTVAITVKTEAACTLRFAPAWQLPTGALELDLSKELLLIDLEDINSDDGQETDDEKPDDVKTDAEKTDGEQTGGEQTDGEQTGGEQIGGEQTGGEQTDVGDNQPGGNGESAENKEQITE